MKKMSSSSSSGGSGSGRYWLRDGWAGQLKSRQLIAAECVYRRLRLALQWMWLCVCVCVSLWCWSSSYRPVPGRSSSLGDGWLCDCVCVRLRADPPSIDTFSSSSSSFPFPFPYLRAINYPLCMCLWSRSSLCSPNFIIPSSRVRHRRRRRRQRRFRGNK